MAAIQVASLYGLLTLKDEFSSKLADAERNAQSFGSRIQDAGGNISRLGTRMTAATAPIAAGLGVAINDSRNFSRTMSNINSILGISGQEAADLRAKLLAYGGNTVAGPEKVAQAYYDIVSGVQDASTHMAILDAATKTSEAGQSDLTSTTSAIIGTMNAYGYGADQAAHVSDVFSRTVQTGKLKMDELASALPQVTGLAGQFGLSLDDTAGSLSYLTTKGYTAGQSATFMKSMITSLLSPTSSMSDAIHSLGYSSGEALLRGEGLVGAYQLLSQQNGGLAGLVTNQEALQGAIALTGTNADTFLTNFTTGIRGATEAAREINNESAGWERFTSKIQQLSILAGDKLGPVLLDLMNNKIQPLIDKFIAWGDANPEAFKTLVLITGAAVIAGPILFILGTVISGIGTAVGALTVGAGLLLTPLGAIAVIGAGVAFMMSRPGGLIGSFKEAWQNAQKLAEQLGIILSHLGETQSQLSVWLGMGQGTPTGPAYHTAPTTPGSWSGASAWAGDVNGHAGGGMVKANTPVLVGERGPELFTPSTSGSIHNNPSTQAAMAGAGGDYFDFSNATIVTPSPDDFYRQLEERRRRRR